VAIIRAWYDWDFEGAEREFRLALELNPSDSSARQAYGWFLCAIGRKEEAIVELRRALDVDPLSPELNAQMGWALYVSGREREALEQLQRTVELEPKFWLAHGFRGWIHENKGRIAERIRDLEIARSLDENPELLGELGRAYALAGRRKEANDILHALLTVPNEANRPGWAIAALYTGLAQDEKVLEWLEWAYDQRYDTLPWLNTDPRFKRFHSHPRFQALLGKVGLPIQ
jgi:Flp pilus assembly protein TadD